MKKVFTPILIFIGIFLLVGQSSISVKAACNWKARNAATYFWDSCNTSAKKYSLNGYIAFKTSASCNTYKWTVNGKTAGFSNVLNYAITANGTYTICVRVVDSCNSCDTTYCTTRTITCVPNTCNWKSRYPYFLPSDSCTGKGYKYSVNGYITFNYGKTSCLKYQWTVNGTSAGTSRILNYNITKNGTYVVCMKVKDTCDNCDTTFCSTRTITCVPSGCNWKSKNAATGYWDSCNTTKNKYSLNAYIAYSSKSCFKYQWTVDGKAAGTNYVMNYPITANGSYVICVKVTDTCNNCDTTYCSTRTITCVKNNCNWKSRNPYFAIPDSCDKNNNIVLVNGYIYFNYSKNTCFKYQWTVNATPVNSSSSTPRALNYTITKNGTYVICVKVTDTCNTCDTSFCKTFNITCISGTKCNWKDRKPAHGYWDSCTGKLNKYSLNGYALFTNYFYKSCLKYQWKVNGNNAGNKDIFSYPISANGSYSISVKVTDTCNNCDTTYSTTRTITCVGTSKCNWKSRTPYFSAWDSCTGKKDKYSVNGYVGFNFSKNTCFKYQWSVNGTKVSTARLFSYPITKNGTYAVCVKVTDTCNNCDTTFCDYRNITCVSSGCNWKSKVPYVAYWDSCTGKKNKYSLNAYIGFNSGRACQTYQWTVNGKNAGYGYMMNYPVTASGTYSVCVKVSDTCAKCDTTFCTYRVFNCGSTKCNWKSKGAYFITKDTCMTSIKNYSVNGGIYLPGNSSCYSYSWTVNSNNAGSKQYVNYAITQNGSYAICVKVKDSCNNCDTTYCSTVKVTCVPAGIYSVKQNAVLNLYPNPTEGLVKVDWSEGSSAYIITNATGQILHAGILENGINYLDLNKYPNGLYLLQVRTQQAILTEKLSVQKR